VLRRKRQHVKTSILKSGQLVQEMVRHILQLKRFYGLTPEQEVRVINLASYMFL
jgi:hypothetical protein